jgi:hypothetical protein
MWDVNKSVLRDSRYDAQSEIKIFSASQMSAQSAQIADERRFVYGT